MFGSKRRTNDRLFRQVREALLARLQEDSSTGTAQMCMHKAWLEGGLHWARHSVERVITLEAAWSKRSLERATELTLVFTMPMICWFYSSREKQDNVDSREEADIGRVAMIRLAGVTDPEYARAFDAMHRQFWFEWERSGNQLRPGGILGVEFTLLMDLALKACGHGSALDWARTSFPCRPGGLVWKQAPRLIIPLPDEYAAFRSLRVDSVERMWNFFRGRAANGTGQAR